MSQSPPPTVLAKTVLHDWHGTHGARMVGFAGWDMPVQYPSGILREHLATRRHAGLFDVSHMGRFRVRGGGADAWLRSVLTNDAGALAPGQAQYTLLATATGAAIDDAYLYRLAPEDFLLVVNASNRRKDWDAMHAHLPAPGVSVTDESAALAMIALQGPRSEALLAGIVPSARLPESRRNRLATLQYEGTALIVARTGYTGEAACFELFCARAAALPLWERLVALGAVPCGLGARDSLRLEAGLPLYGHELGADTDGREIPIFAVPLARFAVRAPGRGEYPGRAALDAQRAELDALRSGALTSPPAQRLVKRRVHPIVMAGTRKPLRAGYRLMQDGRPVGYVTSGTTVPVLEGPDETEDNPGLRSIGLALIDTDIGFREPPVELTVDDGRGGRLGAHIVQRHFPRGNTP